MKIILPKEDNQKIIPPVSKIKLPKSEEIKNEFSVSKFGEETIESQYDIGALPGMDKEDLRGERQTVSDKIVNGITQASGKALTSFTSGTAGTVYGLGAMLSTIGSEKGFEFSKLYDNNVTQGLDKIGEYLAKENPLYQTKEYQNMSIPEKLLTANLWWGDVLSGAGYTLGAVGTGALSGGVYRAIAKTLGNTGKFARAGEVLTTATASAIGESGEEGRSAGKELESKLMELATAQYGSEIPQQVLDDIQAKKKATENVVFLINMPFIAGSNFLQFGKTMTNMKSEVKALGEIGESVGKKIEQKALLGDFTKIELTRGEKIAQKAGKILAQPVEEGTKEQLQGAMGTGTKDFYTKKFKGEDADILSSTIEGLKQSYGTQQGWESFVVGALSTLVSGGASKGSALREAFKSDDPQINAALDILDKHNPKEVYKELIQADNRAKTLSTEISEAAAKNDKFEFNNAQHDLLTSYTLSRLKTGQYESLKEDLESIKTMKPEDFQATFGVTPEESNKNSVLALVQKRLDSIDNIAKAYETVETNFSNLSDGNKERLIHASVTIDDVKDRKKELYNDLLKITSKEGSNLLVNFSGQILSKLPGSEKYTPITVNDQFKEELSKINPLRQPEIISLVNDLERLNKREADYFKVFNDISNNPKLQEKLDKKDIKQEELSNKVKETPVVVEPVTEETKPITNSVDIVKNNVFNRPYDIKGKELIQPEEFQKILSNPINQTSIKLRPNTSIDSGRTFLIHSSACLMSMISLASDSETLKTGS